MFKIQEGLERNSYVFHLTHQFEGNEIYYIYRWTLFDRYERKDSYITSINIFDYDSGRMYKSADLSEAQLFDLRSLVVGTCSELIVADKLGGIVYPEAPDTRRTGYYH